MDGFASKFHLNLHLKRFLHNRYNDFLLAEIFRILSLSMISLFIPIFLIKLGFSIVEVVLFEIFATIFTMFLNVWFLEFMIYRINVKLSLILSYFLYVCFYFVLIFADFLLEWFSNSLYFIALVTVFKGLPDVSYWMTHHLYFLKSTKKNNTGKKLGLIRSLPTFAGVVSPILGGVLISLAGFGVAFGVGVLFMILAGVCLMFSSDIKIRKHCFRWKKIWSFDGLKQNGVFFIQGVNDKACGFLWPIFLFLISIKIMTVGVIYFVSNLIYSLTSYFCGKNVDLRGGRIFLKIGSVGHGFSLIFRVFMSTILSITTVQSIGGFFGSILSISLDSEFYKNSHRFPIEAILNRELFLHLGRAFLLSLVLVLFGFFEEVKTLVWVIIFAGFVTGILVLVKK